MFGFKRIVGIEFAPELVQLALQNLAKIQSQIFASTEVDMVCADATRFSYGPGGCVFVLYNPFGTEVMRGFCQQLAKSLAGHPRPL